MAAAAWPYTRAERLEALIGKAKGLADYLSREACDAPGQAAREALNARRAIVEARTRRFQELARVARRNERLGRYLMSPATAQAIAADRTGHLG
jgi:hypothetical protein